MRLVLIGYGKIAQKHMEVFKELGCEFVATCNRSEEGNLQAKISGIPKTYTDYHEMISIEKPDGIINCASFWALYQTTKEIIQYKIPVLVEKPTGTLLAEHLELVQLQFQHETPIQVGFNRRHYSVLKKALEIAGGKDKVTSVSIEWSEDPVHLLKNRRFTNEQVAKIIFGNTIHGLDLLSFLAGEIDNTLIHCETIDDSFGRIMQASGKSRNGVIFNFTSHWTCPVPWRVVFTSAGKRFAMAPLEQCILQQGKEVVIIEPEEFDVKFKAGFYLQAQQFINLIHGKANFSCSLDSATQSMRLAEYLTNAFEAKR
jgi:predicted dehydrogenase